METWLPTTLIPAWSSSAITAALYTYNSQTNTYARITPTYGFTTDIHLSGAIDPNPQLFVMVEHAKVALVVLALASSSQILAPPPQRPSRTDGGHLSRCELRRVSERRRERD